MTKEEPTLHFVCGKIGAGKSTFTTKLGEVPGRIVVREDPLLAALYPGEQNDLADYVRNAGRLRAAIGPHLIELLRSGLSVVLDFPANTPSSRAWMRELSEAASCGHELHFLDVPDEVCRARLHRRNAEGSHEYVVSDEEFDLFTSHFVLPSDEEGLNVTTHR